MTSSPPRSAPTASGSSPPRDNTAQVWPLDPIEGNAAILPLWVKAYTGTELLKGGTFQFLAAQEWKTQCRKLKTEIEQGAKAPPSKWLDQLLAQP